MYSAKHTFFCDSIDKEFLSNEESNHAVRVLRLKEEDLIILINGKGRRAIGKIIVANKKKVLFTILEDKTFDPIKNNIQIAISPTKSMDRLGFFIEKSIEIGIQSISFIRTKNAERKVLNIERIRKNAITALKQSGNLYLPQIDEIENFSSFIRNDFSDKQLFIAHCEDDLTKKEFKNEIGIEKNILILIGPEGDFTTEEINLAKQKDFIPVSLGESRLRTETAGIVACHTVNII